MDFWTSFSLNLTPSKSAYTRKDLQYSPSVIASKKEVESDLKEKEEMQNVRNIIIEEETSGG